MKPRAFKNGAVPVWSSAFTRRGRRAPPEPPQGGTPNAPDSKTISRRRFIRGAATASAAFMIIPSHVLGRGGAKSPNEKLNIAGIGIGGQGGQDIGQMVSENIVALCDVDSAHAGGMFRKFPNAKQHKDYIIRRICPSNGAAGGISEPARWATSAVTLAIRCSAR